MRAYMAAPESFSNPTENLITNFTSSNQPRGGTRGGFVKKNYNSRVVYGNGRGNQS